MPKRRVTAGSLGAMTPQPVDPAELPELLATRVRQRTRRTILDDFLESGQAAVRFDVADNKGRENLVSRLYAQRSKRQMQDRVVIRKVENGVLIVDKERIGARDRKKLGL